MPSPFYFFDEVDAALDTINAGRVAEYMARGGHTLPQPLPTTALNQLPTATPALPITATTQPTATASQHNAMNQLPTAATTLPIPPTQQLQSTGIPPTQQLNNNTAVPCPTLPIPPTQQLQSTGIPPTQKLGHIAIPPTQQLKHTDTAAPCPPAVAHSSAATEKGGAEIAGDGARAAGSDQGIVNGNSDQQQQCVQQPGSSSLPAHHSSALPQSPSPPQPAQYIVVSHRPQVFERAACLIGVYSTPGSHSGAVVVCPHAAQK